MTKFKVESIPETERKLTFDEGNLKFGAQFTDYMFMANYAPGKEWHDFRMAKFANIPLSPAANVLHYAQEIFEGLKAFRHQDGSIHIFRPDKNIARFNISAERMVMPTLDPNIFLTAMKELVAIEKQAVPSKLGSALYLRPTMIATESALGVKASSTYLFYIIASPSGPYFASGFNPVKIWVSDQWVRAVRGGVGEAKTGGNYAASLFGAKKAKEAGYEQVLWLDALEMKYIEEVGAMNMFFVMDGDTLVTAPLDGSVLRGVTRESVIELAPELGYKVEERKISIDQVLSGIESGKITEAFGTGTAAAISPVGELSFKGKAYVINNFKVGQVAQKLYDELTGIQYGTKKDTKNWLVRVE